MEKKQQLKLLSSAKPGDTLLIEGMSWGAEDFGIQIKLGGACPVVETVVPGSTADESGVRAGDELRELCGRWVCGGGMAVASCSVVDASWSIAVRRGRALLTLPLDAPRVPIPFDGPKAKVKAADLLWGLWKERAGFIEDWAATGDPEGIETLAYERAYGHYMRPSAREAARLARTAAEAGRPHAQALLGRLLAYGDGVAKDEAEARSWLTKAADAGDGDAALTLAHLEADARPKEAQRWLEKATVAGSTVAAAELGDRFAGQGETQNAARAWTAAALRSWNAPFLGRDPEGLWRYVAARQVLERSDGGTLAYDFLRGVSGPADPIAAYELADWFERHDRSDWSAALLGWLQWYGVVVPADHAKAVATWRGARFVFSAAENNIALAELLGDGVDRDEADGWKLADESLSGGRITPIAYYNRGLMLERGFAGRARSLPDARAAYASAAGVDSSFNDPDPWSQTRLAEMLLAGEGGPVDVPQAAALLQKAAKSGDPVAQFRLGELYEKGRGVVKDPQQAALWFRRAADFKGDPRGETRFPDFAIRLRADQLGAKTSSEPVAALRAAAERKARALAPPSPGRQLPEASGAEDAAPRESLAYKDGHGSLTMPGGVDLRPQMLRRIGAICSSKNIGLVAGHETSEGGVYRVTDESLQSGRYRIEFDCLY